MPGLKNIEVELKFSLVNKKELIAKLQSIAKLGKENDLQKDTYYIPAHRNFLEKLPILEWLRLRETPKESSINYKRWHNENGKNAVSCDEFETKVEEVDELKNILARLNFTESIIVEKTRTTYHYKDVEIAIDDVKDLGAFIELEAKGNFASIEEAEKHLHKVLEELKANVGKQEFKGYPHQLLEKKGLL